MIYQLRFSFWIVKTIPKIIVIVGISLKNYFYNLDFGN